MQAMGNEKTARRLSTAWSPTPLKNPTQVEGRNFDMRKTFAGKYDDVAELTRFGHLRTKRNGVMARRCVEK